MLRTGFKNYSLVSREIGLYHHLAVAFDLIFRRTDECVILNFQHKKEKEKQEKKDHHGHYHHGHHRAEKQSQSVAALKLINLLISLHTDLTERITLRANLMTYGLDDGLKRIQQLAEREESGLHLLFANLHSPYLFYLAPPWKELGKSLPSCKPQTKSWPRRAS